MFLLGKSGVFMTVLKVVTVGTGYHVLTMELICPKSYRVSTETVISATAQFNQESFSILWDQKTQNA